MSTPILTNLIEGNNRHSVADLLSIPIAGLLKSSGISAEEVAATLRRGDINIFYPKPAAIVGHASSKTTTTTTSSSTTTSSTTTTSAAGSVCGFDESQFSKLDVTARKE